MKISYPETVFLHSHRCATRKCCTRNALDTKFNFPFFHFIDFRLARLFPPPPTIDLSSVALFIYGIKYATGMKIIESINFRRPLGRFTKFSMEYSRFTTPRQLIAQTMTYYSVSSALQIFWIRSLNEASPQNSLGFDGEEWTLRSLNRIMKIIANTARNVVDILIAVSLTSPTRQFHSRSVLELNFHYCIAFLLRLSMFFFDW